MNNDTIKSTGATFTPEALADFVAKKIICALGEVPQRIKVMDPACGDGSLLLAIGQLLKEKRINNYSLIGYDTNADYINDALSNLRSADLTSVELKNADFLLSDTSVGNEADMFSQREKTMECVDVVIANPPYVRTQVLGADRSQRIAEKYNLRGKIDLYHPFLISMTNSLKAGGVIGVITSNRYLTTKSGGQIRKFLLDNYEILEVIDLGDTKLFDAAVLPAVFIGRKKSRKDQPVMSGKFARIYEDLESGDTGAKSSVFDILDKGIPGRYSADGKTYNYNSGLLKHSPDRTDIWQMTDEKENEWIRGIKKNAAFFIGDKFKVRVGVKSCADKVFIKRDWAAEEIVPEDVFFKPLLSQENIHRWNNTLPGERLSILYPHYDDGGARRTYDIEQYPRAKAFFEKNNEVLRSRKYLIQSGRKWYELWVPQDPALWKSPKIVFPDISIEPRFYFDKEGAIVNGNCYWIVAKTPQEEDLLFLIQGVANSRLMSRYHDLCFNNKLYSGRRRYLSRYIEKYPIPDPTSAKSVTIVELVRELNRNSAAGRDITVLESQLNATVNAAFGVKD